MKARLQRWIFTLIPILIFSVSLIFLTHFLKQHTYAEISADLMAIEPEKFFAAILVTLFSYAMLTVYDLLGVRYVKSKLSFARIALTSFLAYSISNSVGFAGLAGNSIRFRNYSRWSLSPGEIMRIILIVGIGFWLGFLAVAGFAFTLNPIDITQVAPIAPVTFQILGILFLGIVLSYLLICAFRKQPMTIRSELIEIPSLRLALSQVIIAIADWTLSAYALYALLPKSDSMTFSIFLSLFCAAQAVSLLTHVPGGVGVLEVLIIFFVSADHHPTPRILAALLAYRLIYYLAPMVVGLITLALIEGRRNLDPIRKATRSSLDFISGSTPFFVSWSIFAAGIILLWSAFTPADSSRLEFLNSYFDLSLIESSHFISGIVGTLLLVLARGLQNRSYPAYRYASMALLSGAILSILKGGDYEEAIALIVIFLLMRRVRDNYYRQSNAIPKYFNVAWVIAISMVIIGTIWVGFLSFKHVEYTNDLWTTFTLKSDASRFLRSVIGAIGIIIVFAFYSVIFPKDDPPQEALDHEKIKSIIALSKKTIGNLALLDDKRILYSKNNDAFIMYAIQGRSWVALGDPVGNEESFEELLWDFKEFADSYGARPVFYQIGPEKIYIYAGFGMKFLKLGEEAIVNLKEFTIEGRAFKNLRASINKFEKLGATFEVVPKAQFATIYDELKRVSDSWLSQKTASEKGFSLGVFNKEYLSEFDTMVVKIENRIVAFANIWESSNKYELSIDLMRNEADMFGVMDALFVHLLQWGKDQGYETFNLGMAPLAGLRKERRLLSWNQFGQLIYEHGERFYNFQGLRFYKDKFQPNWEPRYLAFLGSPAQTLADVTLLISGGVRRVLSK